MSFPFWGHYFCEGIFGSLAPLATACIAFKGIFQFLKLIQDEGCSDRALAVPGSSGPELLSPVFLLSSQFEIIEKLSMNLRHLVISLIDIICQTWYVKTIQAGFHGRIRPIVLIQDLNFRDKHIKPFLVFIFCSDVFHVVWTRSDFIGRGLVLSHTISW